MKEAFAVTALKLKPLYIATIPLLLAAPCFSQAVSINNGDTVTIDANTPTDGYTVRNNSTLID